MALFDYKCPKCEHIQEVIHRKISETPVVLCTECGTVMEKQVGVANLFFKGAWFKTEGKY